MTTKKLGNPKEWYLADIFSQAFPRCNTTCKDADGISIIRKQLLKMSNSSCAYCGKKIGNSSLDVDHYLPLSQFQYIAYCWDNLIPACKACNQSSKRDFIPSSLKKIKIVEDSYRTIILMKIQDKAIFAHGFAKGEKGNITKNELEQSCNSFMLYS